jgi:hypothetical protein
MLALVLLVVLEVVALLVVLALEERVILLQQVPVRGTTGLPE